MNINMDIPGLKGVIIEKCEQQRKVEETGNTAF